MGRIIKKGFFWGQKSCLKIWSIAVSFILTLFFGCRPGGWGVAAYGVPEAEYQIRGKVTSSTTGEALKGIAVTNEFNMVLTDKDGIYNITAWSYDETHRLQFEDFDSSNGVHAAVDTIINVTHQEVDSGLKTFDITLDPIEQNENPE